MSDLGRKPLLPVGVLQQHQRLVNVPWFKAPAAVYLELFASDGMGVDHHFAGVGILTKDQLLAAVAAEFPAFWHCLRSAHALDDDIGAVGANFLGD